ncbi:GAF domain-containing sensor histidine kinase [Bacillus sp. T33-2]|uniref:GAF domain-containing sensor histidine kinase n=1 Tax=Bacillus sp. T33-2 TaxID=2054168 RepID=UPI000C759CBA|nr:GAF domain-containing sensor histidine kinase [Bacillus sp. T33-2]PLR99099.1 histidine kinase [Bacillus sp. T33-2]
MDHTLFLKRERYSRLFLSLITLLGWSVILFSFMGFQKVADPVVLALLIAFLFISEYYPIPVWRGFTTITFPLVFIIYLLHGLAWTALVYGGVVLFVNVLQRRALRIILFNPAQLVLSFYTATLIKNLLHPFITALTENVVVQGITEYVLVLGFFFIINNGIVDLVLMIRPQPYSLKMWKQKTMTELNNAGVSLVYGMLLYLLGSQNRGQIDVFSYFFFFSPLVGLALLSSSIARLQKEKKRLKLLFSITTELNQMLPDEEWLSTIKKSFNEFINVEASILWIKEDGVWLRRFDDGQTKKECELSPETFEKFSEIKIPIIYNDRKKDSGIAASCFDEELKSFIYSPLVIENETVGMFIVARSRTKSFEDDDVRSIATLANQMAVVIKTRMLFSEKEKRVILEERNRIARDIHDGVAQTLAGAVMKLETAGKKFTKNPDETIKLVDESVARLRQSLKEVRESIYALRPYPTERVGLTTAISTKIDSISKEYGLDIELEVRGAGFSFSPMVEKVLFDTFQESLQNIIKHANATKVDVLLSNQTEHILMKIKDDGEGFSLFQAMLKARNQPHFGILQMNDAADKINASLQIDSKEGAGTEVTITVPKMGLEGGNIVDQTHASG